MYRVRELFDLIRSYEHKIIPKQHHVILATHVAVTSRDFVLNDQVEQKKFDDYSGGNFEIQYSKAHKKLSVKHIFCNDTYVIAFCLDQGKPRQKQFELKHIFNQNMDLVDAKNIINSIRKTLLDVINGSQEKSQAISHEVSTEPYEPLHIDIVVDETILTESPSTLATPNIFETRK